jgi:hypothetical protein
MGGDLPALGDDEVQEGRRHRASERALLEGAHEFGIDWVGHRRDAVAPERLRGGVPLEGREGADEDEAADAIGMRDREARGDQAAHRVADDDRARQLQPVHGGADVLGEIRGAVARVRLRRVAMAALREGDDAESGRQRREERLIGAPGVRVAVQQQDRRTRGVPMLDTR